MSKIKCFALVFTVAASILFHACNVQWGDKVVIGKEDTSLPGASLQQGCVLKIERGKVWYPPEPDTVLFEDPEGRNQPFTRYVDFGTKLEVGKCYQWKLGLGDPWSGKTPAVASDTVREIHR